MNRTANQLSVKYLLLLLFSALCSGAWAQKQTGIRPGETWPDTDGKHIQAHGGGIIKVGKTYYWYGEERRQGLDTSNRYVSCYSSNDLFNWKNQCDVIELAKPDTMLLGSKWVLERPKVFYNAKTRKYVLYP
ncbi:glycoside hydrolase family protein [Spirosoma flavum]|uniref:Family 43 glycosylhydrolase n=1 Tax=Spirosoma flavum TaxID=2048557 RepID=A0ABW6AKG3_9BACT